MTTQKQYWPADSNGDENWVPVLFYIHSSKSQGYIYCPSALRLLDILNTTRYTPSDSDGPFLKFIDVSDKKHGNEQYASYINKTTVELIALTNGDLARGCGAKGGLRPYPFVQKATVPVLLELRDYTLAGNLHCLAGQELSDILNQDTMFFPVTDATIVSHHNGGNVSCPFVAVRRDEVISSRARSN